MTARTAWMIVSFTILAIISYFLVNRDTLAPGAQDASLPEGYYLNDAVLSTTDDSGVVQYELRAQRIDHRSDDGSIDLQSLELDYGNSTNLWRVSARHGQMPKSNNTIALNGDVSTRLLNAAAHGATQMNSESLNIDITGRTATTDDPVTVRFEGGSLTAIGLDVDLANETFTLRSEVKGVFEAPTR